MITRWALCLALITVTCSMAHAEPASVMYFEITRVKSDDVLNLRAKPDPGAEIVAELPPTTRWLRATGRAAKRDKSVWRQIVWGDGQLGWVNSHYLAVMPPALGLDHPLMCHGTEPFWGIEILKQKALFSTPKDPRGNRFEVRPAMRSGNDTRDLAIVSRDPMRGLTLVLRQTRACSDGMSDHTYRYEAVAIVGGQLLSGCCNMLLPHPGEIR